MRIHKRERLRDDDDFAERPSVLGLHCAGAAQNDHHVWTSRAPSGREAEDCAAMRLDYSEDQHG